MTPETPPAHDAAGILRAFYVDVGQGDGTIWELPDGSIIIYDCGDEAGSAAENPMNVALKTRLGLPAGSTIHALIASHGHQDHIGGCEEILQEYSVEHLYDLWFMGSSPPASYERFRDQVRAEGGMIHTLTDDPALTSDYAFSQWDMVMLPPEAETGGVKAQIIWPPSLQHASWREIADSSIAVRLTYGDVSYCFQGDIEKEQEAVLAAYPQDLSCDVYLMGHHGSKDASTSLWLAKMRPTVGVVSFGENSYGHPTDEAACRVQQAGAAVYGTGWLGDVIVWTDGQSVHVNPNGADPPRYCG